MGLFQMERSGDEVALAVGTTGWNAGRLPLDWHRRPDARHPFIAQALYRLANDRLEQLGIAGIKHGFFVAAAPGCDEQRCEGPSGQVLHPNCTDTYVPVLNGNQTVMGPRYEVNPWTAAWTAATSHVEAVHTHGPLDHRLRVMDRDLDPAQNASATYVVEAYYVHHQNAQPSTAAAWHSVTVRGVPGGEWSFEMGDPAQRPKDGFAISGWQNASVSEIAQVAPVVRGVSPDGRCLLASKVRDLGNGRWRYDYALLNVDMDRQVRSLSVAIPTGAAVTDLYFSAPRQPDERMSAVGGPATDDAAWIAQHQNGQLTWSTITNPLRWGVMYNFGFTSDRSPR